MRETDFGISLATAFSPASSISISFRTKHIAPKSALLVTERTIGAVAREVAGIVWMFGAASHMLIEAG